MAKIFGIFKNFFDSLTAVDEEIPILAYGADVLRTQCSIYYFRENEGIYNFKQKPQAIRFLLLNYSANE